VLRLIADEYSNSEIANKLFISIRTVDTHRRNLLEKLQVKNTAGLVKYAISKGLLGIIHLPQFTLRSTQHIALSPGRTFI
jgi:predicted transcriptional regulator